MRLTQFTEIALRLMIYVASQQGRGVTIRDVAHVEGISRNHLMKVASHLVREGFLRSTRGNGGGLTLAQPAESISVGAILRKTERDFALVEYMVKSEMPPVNHALAEALSFSLGAFLSEADRHSIGKLVEADVAQTNAVLT